MKPSNGLIVWFQKEETMTKSEAKYEFAEIAAETIQAKDYPAIREGWNNYVDSLRSGGSITKKQAETWVNPFVSKKHR